MSEYHIKLRSNYLDSTVNIDVIMPNPFVGHDPEKFYDSGKKFPVLWLLHGGQETFADWITYSSVPRLGIWKNTIIVAPNAPNSDFINQPLVGEGYQFMDFFFHELMPFLYNWFPASSNPHRNFLAGNSMGCEAVWRYGIAHPEKFGCIAPLCSAPCDYSYLEEYRKISTDQFCALAEKGTIPSAYGSGKAKMSIREINSIRKYATVGAFIDSFENSMARFDDALREQRLPSIYMAGNSGDLSAFVTYAQKKHVPNITFSLTDRPVDNMDYLDKAVEDFMNFAGLDNVEKNDGSAPILAGVNAFGDEENGITLH